MERVQFPCLMAQFPDLAVAATADMEGSLAPSATHPCLHVSPSRFAAAMESATRCLEPVCAIPHLLASIARLLSVPRAQVHVPVTATVTTPPPHRCVAAPSLGPALTALNPCALWAPMDACAPAVAFVIAQWSPPFPVET